MSHLTDQKSLLAKLMATENIRIEHKKISTAAFDPVNRVMYLPIWKDMEGSIYDLLTGHEVGHALYTPAAGWHDSISERGKNYKGFLNVVEDARIEKKVQRRYPGLRHSFKMAYELLFYRDFFEIKNRDINEMAFIDRLNIYTKSQYTRNDIEFNDKELVFVERARNLETWEDVVKLTDDIFEYSKDEKNNLNDFDFEFDFDELLGAGKEYEDGFADDFEKQKGDKDKNKNKDQNSEKVINRDKESENYTGDGSEFNEPFSETDYAFRNNEHKFVDESSKEYVYLRFPKPDLQRIVTPAKLVHQHMNKCFYVDQQLKDLSEKLFLEFRNHNERYVSLLVKEFEMRKAATVYDKRKQSETGDIDISKLSSYKFDDNIFKRLISVPKGKSHGLMLLLDYSGSMRENLGGSIEQILVLAMFCRKVNIEFGVYAFSNSTQTLAIDYPKKYVDEFYAAKEIRKKGFFSQKENELNFTMVQLREYLNSDMSTSEFKSCVKNMLLLRCHYDGDWRKYQNYGVPFYLPHSECLSNTPLTQAVVAMAHILKDFKQKKNLDIVNLAIVHDGDADGTNTYVTKTGPASFSFMVFRGLPHIIHSG